MSLNKEKELLKEIEELKKAKKLLFQAQASSIVVDGSQVLSGNYKGQLTEINKELTSVKKEIEKHHNNLNKLAEKRKDAPVPGILKQRDALREEKKKKQDEIQALWDDFKAKNDEWKKNMEERNAYRDARNKAMKAEQQRLSVERRKAREEELAKKTPYEEEMQLCDYLTNYLTTTFLTGKDAADGAAEESKSEDVTFDGATEVSSKRGKDQMFMVLGNKKKKGKKQRSAQGTRKGKIVLHPDTIDAFSLLKMTPPATVEQVASCVGSLAEKKDYFSNLPRGSVESIAEMNQKLEIQEENRRPQRDSAGGKPSRKSSSKASSRSALDAQDLEAFPTLGGGAKPSTAQGAQA